jgi:hypothetical protein
MEVRSQFHVPAALLPGKDCPASIGEVAGRTAQPV